MQNYTEQKRIQYLADILILGGLALLGAMVFGLLGAVAGKWFFGIEMDNYAQILANPDGKAEIGFLKFYNVLSTFGAWVLSGYLLSKFRTFNVSEVWKFKMPETQKVWLLIIPVFFCLVVVSAYLLELNSRIAIPEAIRSSFESFNTGKLLKSMLAMHNNTDLIINLIVIAIVPAIFEEIFFRGSLQSLLIGLFKNHHLGIWTCSIIFALIHLNIDQLLPMLFLALVLGYLFYYTQSIYPGILIHLLNNGMAVTAYYLRDSNELANKVTYDSLAPDFLLFLLCSFIIASFFLFIRRESKKNVYE